MDPEISTLNPKSSISTPQTLSPAQIVSEKIMQDCFNVAANLDGYP
jgi:hypothetical protein